jgi:hypothetical protein
VLLYHGVVIHPERTLRCQIPAHLGVNAYIWHQGGMTLVVNINDWLVGDDLPAGPPRLRRNALRVVRFIEYGGPLQQLHGCETLIECKHRPGGVSCSGWMWVVKQNDNRIQVHCPTWHEVEAVISGWEETLWADGPMEPVPMTDD